eukprot:1158165-Pelagomonas_calceolata.AAC.8
MALNAWKSAPDSLQGSHPHLLLAEVPNKSPSTNPAYSDVGREGCSLIVLLLAFCGPLCFMNSEHVCCACRMKEEKAAAYWLKSGRAETEGRLEQCRAGLRVWVNFLLLELSQSSIGFISRRISSFVIPGTQGDSYVGECQLLQAGAEHKGCGVSRSGFGLSFKARRAILAQAQSIGGVM